MAVAYFAATTASAGRELWRLNPEGTVTFWADIDPGAGSGSPNDFTFFNNALWF